MKHTEGVEGFRKAKSFGNAVRVNSELTPFAKMAKAEESFPNWEQNLEST